MSRTAHHIRSPRLHALQDRSTPASRPWRRIDLTDLRYSTATLRRAAAEGRRPYPTRVQRRVRFDSYLGAYGRGRYVTTAARVHEHAARARLREHTAVWRSRLGAATCLEEALDPFEGWDVPSPHHRHQAVWDAW